MKLSELPVMDFISDIKIQRNGEFDFASKLDTKLFARLVPCNNERAIRVSNENPEISCVIVTPDNVDIVSENKGCLVSSNPLEALYEIHKFLANLENDVELKSTIIHPTAKIHSSVVVSETGVVIERNVIIGPNCVIESNVRIREGAKLYQGCHIGCHPFDLNNQVTPNIPLEPIGGVLIEKNAIMLTGAKIAKATFGGNTVVGESVVIDANVFVAHDCYIEKGVKIAAGAFIGGRTVICQNAYIGPNATLSNGMNIGKNAKISLGAVVIQNVDEGSEVSGHFAIPHLRWLRFLRRGLN